MSIDMTEFVIEMEQSFGLQIPDRDYESLKTVGLLCDYIAEHVPQRAPDEIYGTIRKLLNEHFHIPIEDIARDSRWIEDLGLG